MKKTICDTCAKEIERPEFEIYQSLGGIWRHFCSAKCLFRHFFFTDPKTGALAPEASQGFEK